MSVHPNVDLFKAFQSVPPCYHEAFGDDMKEVQVHHTIANGDCLFESLRFILASIQMTYDNRYMRSVVARSILDHRDEVTQQALHGWYVLFQEIVASRDPGLWQEYAYMEPSRRQQWPLPKHTIHEISDAMMKPHLYWGEEHALRIFERQLQVRALVFEEVKLGQNAVLRLYVPLDHGSAQTQYHPTHYILLHLCRKHYQPLSYRKQFIFQPSELPSSLQRYIRGSEIKFIP